ncbi:monosaccharide ABC transporter substrate-binding protein, CUT2 family [Faunimonas pinastri]|uniref:Monosaccharide ABC transporter substrate-binding protein, CUT2 family n=1 Tax=Faunimonas pinastri TaxID=1855383 RepID=A0A1H9EUV4_9HYPH|nr:ABC transporter substrate-binding protein [Faunimonas pinastri]SEQ28768.1 monosaccharide ABC transporter substrate-binding protein, CUT2 family [Faunimonas pinastri]
MRTQKLCRAALMVTAALAVTPAMAKDITKVGITVGSLGNPYYAVTNKGIQETIAKLTPGAQVTAVSADYDLGKQFNQIDNFIASGAKIIMLNAVDPVGIKPAIAKAKAAGVTVSAFDVTAEGVDVTVMTDNVEAGRQACQYIVDHLPGGKGDVIIVNGPPISAIVDRVKGCQEVLSAHPEIKVLSSDQNGQASRDGGLAAGQGLLTRFSKVDAIFAVNDPTAIGVDLAAKQLQRGEFFITAVDGSPDVVTAMESGSSLIKASSAQAPYKMASEAYRYAVDITNGKAPPEKTVLLKPELVTADNVKSYGGWSGE